MKPQSLSRDFEERLQTQTCISHPLHWTSVFYLLQGFSRSIFRQNWINSILVTASQEF